MFLLPRSASKLFASSSSTSTSAAPSAAELHSSASPPDEHPSCERVGEIAKSRMAESVSRTAKDVKDWSDISRMQNEADGSFKRKPSGFRNWVEKGGKFEPERGACAFSS